MGSLMARIEQKGLLFGSRLYGGYTEKSDYDYLVYVPDEDTFIKFLNNNGVKTKDIVIESGYENAQLGNDSSIMFMLEDKEINIILYTKLDKWKSAKNAYKKLKLFMENETSKLIMANSHLRHRIVELVFDSELN